MAHGAVVEGDPDGTLVELDVVELDVVELEVVELDVVELDVVEVLDEEGAVEGEEQADSMAASAAAADCMSASSRCWSATTAAWLRLIKVSAPAVLAVMLTSTAAPAEAADGPDVTADAVLAAVAPAGDVFGPVADPFEDDGTSLFSSSVSLAWAAANVAPASDTAACSGWVWRAARVWPTATCSPSVTLTLSTVPATSKAASARSTGSSVPGTSSVRVTDEVVT